MKITPEVIIDNLKLCEKVRNPWIEQAEKGWRLVYEQDPSSSEIGSGTLNYKTKENRIHAKLLDWRSILLKNKPTFRVQATKPEDIDLSDAVTAVAYKKWKDIKALAALSRSQLEVGYAGLAVLRYTRTEVTNGKYIESVVNVPRGDFWHNPKELHIGDGWCCYRTWNTLDNLRTWFSKRKVDITVRDAEETSGMPVHMEAEEARYRNTGRKGLAPTFSGDVATTPPDGWGKNLYPLYEFWAPPAMTEADDWKVYYLLEDKILLELANPYAQKLKDRRLGHGQPPFVAHRCYWKPDEKGYIGFYSVEGIAEHLETVQYDLTETARALMLMTRRAAQPPTIEEENSLVDDSLSYEPNARNIYRITKSPPTIIEAGLTTSVPINAYKFKRDALNEISGIRDFMTGEEPRGTSGTPTGTVMFAQEASFIRMPDIIQELDCAITALGWLILGNMQQFTNPGEFIDVTIGGQPAWIEWTQKHIDTEFNLEVVAGMTTILRDIDRQQNATNLLTQVSTALASKDIGILKATKQWLLMLDEPSGYGYLPVIDEEIAILEQAIQLQSQLPILPEQMEEARYRNTGREEARYRNTGREEARYRNTGRKE